MKKMTAVMAVVMVLGVALMTATPASAAPTQISNSRPTEAPAALIGLLERMMQLFGFKPTISSTPAPSAPAGHTPTTDEVIWGGSGRCVIPGACR